MRLKNVLKQTLFIIGLGFIIVACEEDFGSLGTDIVGEVNFETAVSENLKVTAYSMNYADGNSFNGVQSNNLPGAALGFYNDPVYGATTASYLSQVTLSQYDPEFGENPVIDSVVFSMPYYSTLIETDEDGVSTYVIDSIFGNAADMKLSVYRSNYFLNSLDPDSNFEDPAVYYSNEIDGFSGIESELIFEDSNFRPDASEIELETPVFDDDGVFVENEVTERVSPRYRVRLDIPNNDDNITIGNLNWNELILNQEGQNVLLNQNAFSDYFRGLYIKAEATNGTGSYILLNPFETNITIYYSSDDTDDTDEVAKNLSINMGGVNAVHYGTDFSRSPIGAVDFNSSQNMTDGEDNLYLKGGDGSIAIIELFGRDENGYSEQLENLRSCNLLIREANLTFFVDQDALGFNGTGTREPERVFIYDYDNNEILLDASFDPTQGADGPLNTRINHLGRLKRERPGDLTTNGVSYKIRVTQHINNIVRNDSTNVRLALAVSQNVTVSSNSLIGGVENEIENNRVPASSVISPEGTILHGSTSSNESKRLKLRLYYTLTEEIDPDSPCGIALGL